MIGPRVSIHAAANGRRAWVAGGALLIASAVFGLGVPPLGAMFIGGSYIGMACFTFAVLLFAFGFRGSGSVTARRPLGTTALVVLALWLPLTTVIQQIFLTKIEPSATSLAFGLAITFVQFAAALIAVSQINHAGVIPRPWNWAPTWALGAVMATWIVVEIAARTAAQTASDVVLAVASLDQLAHTVSVIFLGVVALVIANRFGRSQTIAVYRNPDADLR